MAGVWQSENFQCVSLDNWYCSSVVTSQAPQSVGGCNNRDRDPRQQTNYQNYYLHNRGEISEIIPAWQTGNTYKHAKWTFCKYLYRLSIVILETLFLITKEYCKSFYLGTEKYSKYSNLATENIKPLTAEFASSWTDKLFLKIWPNENSYKHTKYWNGHLISEFK